MRTGDVASATEQANGEHDGSQADIQRFTVARAEEDCRVAPGEPVGRRR